MAHAPDESRIQAAFERLRQADERTVPSFERVLSRPAQRPPLASAVTWQRATTAGLVLLLLAGVALLGPPAQRSTPVLSPDDVAPFYWRSPTTALLAPPGDLATWSARSGARSGQEVSTR